jgi:hypothetical protein
MLPATSRRRSLAIPPLDDAQESSLSIAVGKRITRDQHLIWHAELQLTSEHVSESKTDEQDDKLPFKARGISSRLHSQNVNAIWLNVLQAQSKGSQRHTERQMQAAACMQPLAAKIRILHVFGPVCKRDDCRRSLLIGDAYYRRGACGFDLQRIAVWPSFSSRRGRCVSRACADCSADSWQGPCTMVNC